MFASLLFRYHTALRKYIVLFRGAHLQFLGYLYQVTARCAPVPQSAYLGYIYQYPVKGNSSEDKMTHTGHSPNKHFACNHIRGAATLQLAPVLQTNHGLPQAPPYLPDTLWPGTTHVPTKLQNISDNPDKTATRNYLQPVTHVNLCRFMTDVQIRIFLKAISLWLSKTS